MVLIGQSGGVAQAGISNDEETGITTRLRKRERSPVVQLGIQLMVDLLHEEIFSYTQASVIAGRNGHKVTDFPGVDVRQRGRGAIAHHR